MSQLLILLGAGIMLLSLIKARHIIAMLKQSQYHHHWWLLVGLMGAFFMGYLGTFVLVLLDMTEIFQSLVGVIFFLGALFVYAVVQLEHVTIDDLQKKSRLQQQVTQHQERDNVARLIERSKRLLMSAVDSTPDWIFAKDSDLRFILVNKSFAETFNLAPPEIIGKTAEEIGFIHAEQEQSNADDLMVLQGKTFHIPEQLITFSEDEQYIHDTYKLPLRDSNGQIFGVLEFSRDITAPKKLEAEFVAQQDRLLAERQETIRKLQAVDRAKSQFITMISHELRTPLNAINGFSELLLTGLSGEISEEAKQDVQVIFNSGQHLIRLINDILDITKLEVNQIELHLQPLEIPPLVAEVVTANTPLFSQKSIQLITNIADPLPCVYADPTRLKQILINLLSNAAKFTNTGTVTVTIAPHLDPAFIRFSVQDTGVGIAKEKQQAIFDMFEQGDMSDAREYAGIGVGLSISKALVQMHHGDIGVESQSGVGSEFFFTLPVYEDKPDAKKFA